MRVSVLVTILFSVISLSITAPVNDKCQNAIELKTGQNSTKGDITGATIDFSGSSADSCVASYYGGLVWYKVKGNGRTIRVHTSFPGTLIDTVVNVFEGTMCQNLPIKKSDGGNHYCINGNDDYDANVAASSVEFCTENGKDYLISVGGHEGEEGVFYIQAVTGGICKQPALNAECEDAEKINVGQTMLSLVSNGKVPVRGNCLTLSDSVTRPGKGLWYTIRGTGHNFQIVIGGELNMVQTTFRVFAVDSNMEGCMYFNDWNLNELPASFYPICTGGSTGHSGYTWPALKDQLYAIFVEGYEGANGGVGWAVAELTGSVYPTNVINTNIEQLVDGFCAVSSH